MRVIDLALKDLLQIVRDKQSTFFLVLMPLAFTFFFGLMFSGGGDDGGDPRLPVGVVDHDQAGVLSAGLQDLLEASETVRPVLLQGEEAENAAEAVRDEEWAAVIVVPEGFSAQSLAGEEARPTVIVDLNTQAGQTANSAIQAATTRLLGAVQMAHISAETSAAAGPFGDQAARQAYVDQALALAFEAWQRSPLTLTVQEGRASDEDDDVSDNPYTQSSPGIMVQFAIFGMTMSSALLVLERRSGALQRLLTTPIRRAEVIAGHILSAFVVSFCQQAVLVAVGQLAFDVDYMREPLAILMVMAALAFWVSSTGLFVGAVAKNEDQVVVVSLIAMMVLSAMGGAWFPLDITGKAFAAIGHLTPTAWAMDGFQNIVQRGLGLNAVLLPVGVLLAYGLAFFGLAVWRLKLE
jgi:ABC-2 type transport system permease protein